MSALPPQIPKDKADPHKMSQAANLQHATQKVNRFAKRDPALYPLSIIVAGGLCAAGYFFMSKTTQGETHTKLMADGVVNPWDNASKHDTHPSQLAAFKYRHQTREGHMEDSLPTLTQDVRDVKSGNHKFYTNK